MTNSKQSMTSTLRCFASLLVLGGLSVPVQAAEHRLEVRVLDKHTGTPVSDAAVCVGTSADASQFGARRTDAKGSVQFGELLSHSMVVTASKTGYQGSETSVQPLTEAGVVVVKIVPGGGGPHCDAPESTVSVSAGAGLKIRGISVRKDPAREQEGGVLLYIAHAGSANQTRISEQADFSNAQWQDLQQPVPFQLSDGNGPKLIYVQVRRHVGQEGASIEAVSSVQGVRYSP
jgi:hypothetical protein